MKKWIEIAGFVWEVVCLLTLLVCLLVAYFQGNWAEATFWLVGLYIYLEKRPKRTTEEAAQEDY